MTVKVTLVKCWYMAFVLACLLDWEGEKDIAVQNVVVRVFLKETSSLCPVASLIILGSE